MKFEILNVKQIVNLKPHFLHIALEPFGDRRKPLRPMSQCSLASARSCAFPLAIPVHSTDRVEISSSTDTCIAHDCPLLAFARPNDCIHIIHMATARIQCLLQETDNVTHTYKALRTCTGRRRCRRPRLGSMAAWKMESGKNSFAVLPCADCISKCIVPVLQAHRHHPTHA